jgi:hypothetical protein
MNKTISFLFIPHPLSLIPFCNVAVPAALHYKAEPETDSVMADGLRQAIQEFNSSCYLPVSNPLSNGKMSERFRFSPIDF